MAAGDPLPPLATAVTPTQRAPASTRRRDLR